WHKVVVVEIHAIRTERRELLDDPRRREGGAYRIAKRIAADVPNGPKSEREVVLRTRRVAVGNGHCSVRVSRRIVAYARRSDIECPCNSSANVPATRHRSGVASARRSEGIAAPHRATNGPRALESRESRESG